ncbi:MAG: UDP-glucose 4-epimerase GalE [Bacteriovoracales bacterium]|nr:UDP-glucose 4-epimerase GalE [Bacteriovoracales bacterium]
MGKILVTGGAGYVGSHVVNILGKAGHSLIVIDNLSSGKKESILYGKFIHADLSHDKKIDEILACEDVDACLHFAGSIVVPESFERPLDYYQNNTFNSHKLIASCSRHGVKAFIFSSTAAVYGHNENGQCSENAPLAPTSPYGRSKLATEWILEDAARVGHLKHVSLRYFNVSGASVDGRLGQNSPQATHLLKVACETAIGKRKGMDIFGTDYPTYDGTCIRDYIHVDDLAKAHLDALTYLLDGGQSATFNCGYGHGHSVKEVVSTVKKVSGEDFPVRESRRRPGDPPKLIAIPQKIKSELDWKPQYDDLEFIIKTAYEWEKNLLSSN